jgi:hypothetical protein
MSNLMSKYKRSSPSLVNTPLQVSLLDHGASCSTGRINRLLGSFLMPIGATSQDTTVILSSFSDGDYSQPANNSTQIFRVSEAQPFQDL